MHRESPDAWERVAQGSLSEYQSSPEVARHWLGRGCCAEPGVGEDDSQRPNTSRHRGYRLDSRDDAKLYKEFL
jgi:hypothetical protein